MQIPKPGGKGVRQLGIPTVVDRLVQQAALQVGVASQSRERLTESLKELTCRNAGKSFERAVQSVNQKLTGWIQYFRMARMKSVLEEIAQWLRRRLCCLKLKQCKKPKPSPVS